MWKVRKHGYSKRRSWRKIHVGMCADSGQIVVSALSSNNISDDEAMVHMMDALDGTSLGDVLGDGAYDTLDCREAVHEQGGNPIFPPDKNAKLQKGKPLPALHERDQAIRRIQELGEEGRSLWKQEMGYHRRSRVETFMFRYKTILGDRLTARRQWTPSYRGIDQNGRVESDDRTGDAEKLQGDQLNQAPTRQLRCLD